jgi:hypothetical protein
MGLGSLSNAAFDIDNIPSTGSMPADPSPKEGGNGGNLGFLLFVYRLHPEGGNLGFPLFVYRRLPAGGLRPGVTGAAQVPAPPPERTAVASDP